jgi:predicted acylesterase/phospholipase RssA/CRP-like cAMP-binding protein
MNVDDTGTDLLVDALRDADVFSDLPEDVRVALAGYMTTLAVDDGATVIEQGRPGTHMYVVIDGGLEIHATSHRGAMRQMPQVGRHRLLGEANLLVDAVSPVTARAQGLVLLAALSRDSFVRFGADNPAGMFAVMEGLRPAFRRHRLRTALHMSRTFGDLDPAVLDDLEVALEFVPLYGGEVLMRQGEPGDDMFIVLGGRLRVTAAQPNGSPEVIAELGVGDTVGEMALIDGMLRGATVSAVRDTQLARLSKASFEWLLSRHPRTTFAMIAGRLVARLRMETTRARRHRPLATIAVLPASPGVPLRAFAERLAVALSRLGSTLHLSSDIADGHLGAAGVAQSFDREHHGAHLCEWLAERELEHRFVVYESDDGLSPWTERSIRQADHVVLVADASADPAISEIEAELLERSTRYTPRRTLALVHPAGDAAPHGTARWLRHRTITRHMHMRIDDAGDFERLARLTTGNGVALALGGGFARGLAHLGVFRALQELGIPVDAVGGSSMGAMVGAQWALGWSPQDIAMRTSEGFAASFDDMTLPFLSFKRGGKHSGLIRDFFGDRQIEDLWFPYFCVSTNLNRSSLKIHTSGSLAVAVTASTRAPGIFPPLVIDGELHIDGGMINNVPVDVMSDFTDGGIVIGVDVSPPHELNEVVNYGDDVSGWHAAWSRFNPNRQKRSYRPSILLVLMRVIEFGGISYRRTKAEMADLYISPEVLRFKRNDFRRFAELADAGYTAAHGVLKQWLTEGHEQFAHRRPDLFPGVRVARDSSHSGA